MKYVEKSLYRCKDETYTDDEQKFDMNLKIMFAAWLNFFRRKMTLALD